MFTLPSYTSIIIFNSIYSYYLSVCVCVCVPAHVCMHTPASIETRDNDSFEAGVTDSCELLLDTGNQT